MKRRYSTDELKPDDIAKRIALLDSYLEHRVSYCDDSLLWWTRWHDSNFVALPFSGAWLDQPQWLIDDFEYYDAIKEIVELQKELKRIFEDSAKRALNGG